MDLFADFLHMGGYAYFVWSAYGVVIVSLIAALVMTWRGLKAREREFEAVRRDRQSTP